MEDNCEAAINHLLHASGVTAIIGICTSPSFKVPSEVGVNTGAGISVAAGIPAFRGQDGQHKKLFEGFLVRDLFDFQTIARSSTAYRAHCKYVASMARVAIQAEPTKFHQLLRILNDCRLLHRIYSQNVDGLEAKAGFDVFSNERTRRCILLHGNVATVRCEKCASLYMLENFLPPFQDDPPLFCPACVNEESEASALGKRARMPGRLRPNILLFNEPSSIADEVADITVGDSNLVQDNHVLLISGTSLKIPSVQSISNDFIKAMLHSKKKNCAIIYVDNAPKKPSVLPQGTIHVQMDCQQFAELTTSRMKTRFSLKDAYVERRDFRPLWDWS